MAEPVTIHRDEWGIPHVYADTEEGAAYGLGWAQAEDRLEQLLKNYRMAAGTMAEVFGPDWIEHDWEQRVVGHEEVCRRRYPDIPDETRAMIEAFQAGLLDYLQAHPEQVPDWAPAIEPWQVPALGRFIIFGWPMGAAHSKLERREAVELPFYSNEWAVRPERTQAGYAILCIDPHIPWHGKFRFYEFRAHAGSYHVSGFGPLGSPLLGLGHNRYLGWACTTGGPDTTDIYVEEVNPENPLQYRYDGEWRDMAVREVRIDVRGREPEIRELHVSHHGPIVRREGHRAYAVATPYIDEVGFTTQFYHMCRARNLDELKTALAMNQLMEQNFMCADVDGNTFYVRAGRVPIRPEGYDFSKPVPGNTSKTEWRGLHPLSDLVQCLNPARGYMQNCNTGPDTLCIDCPVRPEEYPTHVYNEKPGRTNSRGRRATELLDDANQMTLEQAMAIAVDTHADGAAQWQAAVAAAAQAFAEHEEVQTLEPALNLLARWDGHMNADSPGATLYRALHELGKQQDPEVDGESIRQGHALLEAQQVALLRALQSAHKYLLERHGRLEVPWGEVHRMRRGEQSWPVSGGESGRGSTLRAISADLEDGLFYGAGGQSWVQIVLLRKGAVESYSNTPFGQSDHPQSPHYTDQADRLFSRGRFKPTRFQPESLKGHTKSTTELQWQGK